MFLSSQSLDCFFQFLFVCVLPVFVVVVVVVLFVLKREEKQLESWAGRGVRRIWEEEKI